MQECLPIYLYKLSGFSDQISRIFSNIDGVFNKLSLLVRKPSQIWLSKAIASVNFRQKKLSESDSQAYKQMCLTPTS
jgi:hypothetical protein